MLGIWSCRGKTGTVWKASAMPNLPSATERMSALRLQIQELEEAALTELREKRRAIRMEIDEIDGELAHLQVKSDGRKRSGVVLSSTQVISLVDLKQRLASAPSQTLSVRRENLDLQRIKLFVKANPNLLRLGGKGAWPTVTLLA